MSSIAQFWDASIVPTLTDYTRIATTAKAVGCNYTEPVVNYTNTV